MLWTPGHLDLVRPEGIAYINKDMHKLQNYGLSIVFNQHALHYYLKDSSETLHRKCNIFRLVHSRRLHLLQIVLILYLYCIYIRYVSGFRCSSRTNIFTKIDYFN